MSWREFRFVREDRADLVWKIAKDGESYRTLHGQLNGAMQENSDTPGPKGKEDTNAYVNAEDNCDFHISREIRRKMEAGYIEYVNGKPIGKQISEIDFNKVLPKNFVGYKPQPQKQLKPGQLEKLCNEGRARFTKKYDGMMHLTVHHNWGWEIYTRGMDLTTERFPNHIAQLSSIESIPCGTIFVGEMICKRADETEDFTAISRLCRSDPPEARKLVEREEVPEPSFVIFDLLFYDGQDLKSSSYDERSKFWKLLFPPFKDNDSLICSVDYCDVSHDTWEDFVKENGWEGFVVVDGSSKPGNKFYSFNGKAKRPAGHYKLKPIYESDVVIFAGLYGTGKRMNMAGSAFIKQIDPNTGKYFNCGRVGTGFTDETLAELQGLLKENELPILKKKTEVKDMNIQNDRGVVAMIKYPERIVGTNKFRFPSFQRFRFDKKPEECEAQNLCEDEPLKLDFLE